MNAPRAILFYGASPGAGKSTLSSFLYQQLTRHRIPVLWIYEDDVHSLPHFTDFVAQIRSGDPQMMATLLEATSAFVQETHDAGLILITDSIYPCINWLIASDLYSRDELANFSAQLEGLLAPLSPLVVFLDADPQAALQRAIDQRGHEWFDGLLEALNSYAVNRLHPLRTLEEASTYFETQGQLSLSLLKKWDCDLLVLDAMQTPLARAKAMVLDHLGLRAWATGACVGEGPAEDDELLAHYAGAYQAVGDTSDPNPIVIRVEENILWVNRYWPKGCPLIDEGNGRFRLENTSHLILFKGGMDGSNHSLTYVTAGERIPYQKE